MPPQVTISKLRSKATGRFFSSVVFSGDTDMATDGWVALTSIDKPEIVITKVSSDEHRADDDGLLWCEERVNSALARSDLRVVWFKRTGDKSEGPRRLFYRDIFDSEGDAEFISQQSVAEFEKQGGKIIYYKAN